MSFRHIAFFTKGGLLRIPPFFFMELFLVASFQADRSSIEQKFLELCHVVVSEQGLDLYDIEYIPQNQLLRIYIENPETKSANLDECVKVDRAMTPVIEENDWMPEALVLEVSSPGVYRHLAHSEHLERVIGERILINLAQKIDFEDAPKKFKASKKLIGILKNVEKETLQLSLDGWEAQINLNDIKKASLEPDWDSIKSGDS